MPAAGLDAPTEEEIHAAAARIMPHVLRTPVRTSKALDGRFQSEIFFKCENFQRMGAFKFRGACSAVFNLSDEVAKRGVATHSSGNHAQALALAAKMRGIEAHVVMPSNSSRVKVEGARGHGADITFCEPTLRAREEALAEVVARTGAEIVHPYDNPHVIAGQATAAMELFADVPDLDIIIAPVGGGGLLSGTSLAVKYWSPGTKAYGAEPAGADDAYRSIQAGELLPQTDPRTVADGLRTSLCPRTFGIIRANAAGIVTVKEEAILEAVRAFHKEMGMVVEPSGAVPLAAMFEGKLDVDGKRVGVIVSGGNIDPDVLQDILERPAAAQGTT